MAYYEYHKRTMITAPYNDESTITCRRVNGVWEGAYTLTDTNHSFTERGIMVNGIKNGPYKCEFADGDVETGARVNGRKHGLVTVRRANGNIVNFNHVDGKMTGPYNILNSDGSFLVGMIDSDTVTSNSTIIFPSGQIQRQSSKWIYGNEIHHGPFETIFTNGTIVTGHHENGIKSGPYTKIYANGSTEVGIYNNGHATITSTN